MRPERRHLVTPLLVTVWMNELVAVIGQCGRQIKRERVFMKAGNRVEVEIEKTGILSNPVADE